MEVYIEPENSLAFTAGHHIGTTSLVKMIELDKPLLGNPDEIIQYALKKE